MTRTSLRFPKLGLWLVATALALRLFIAPGFMPVVGPEGITISMCSGKASVYVPIPGKSDPAMPSSSSCAFAALAVALAPEIPAVLAPPAMLAPTAPLLIPLIRAPHIGAPAPPPPAIGPPALI